MVVKVNMNEQYNFLVGKVEMNNFLTFILHIIIFFKSLFTHNWHFLIFTLLVFPFEIPDFFGSLEKALGRGKALQ